MALYSVLLGCFMMFLIILYNISSAAKYYLKFVFFIGSSIFNVTIVMPFMFIRPKNYKNALIPAFLCRQCARLLGLTWDVRGQENIDNTTGNVVLVNHQSSIDLFVLSCLWPLMREGCVISKRILFYVWPFGLCCWLWGTVFIDRDNKKKAQNTLNQTTEVINTRKAKVLLFPEGTRHSGEKLLPFKKGAFHTALDAGCPILPVVVSKYYFLDAKKPRFGKGHFIIEILPSIPTKGLTKEDMPQLIDKLQNIMQSKYTEITNEVLKYEASNSLISNNNNNNNNNNVATRLKKAM